MVNNLFTFMVLFQLNELLGKVTQGIEKVEGAIEQEVKVTKI